MTNLTVDPQPNSLVSNKPVLVSPSSHNFSKSILIGILIFVLLAATAYGTYWYTKNYLITSPFQPPVSTVPAEISQPKSSFSNFTNEATPAATDETANWKTYTNTKYGFSFKYPEKFKYLAQTSDVISFFDKDDVYESCRKERLQNIGNINSPCLGANFFFNGYQNITFDEYQRLLKSRIYPKDFIDSQGRVWQTDLVLAETYNFDAVINISNKYYSIGFQPNSSFYSLEEARGFINQILSTFKFLPSK